MWTFFSIMVLVGLALTSIASAQTSGIAGRSCIMGWPGVKYDVPLNANYTITSVLPVLFSYAASPCLGGSYGTPATAQNVQLVPQLWSSCPNDGAVISLIANLSSSFSSSTATYSISWTDSSVGSD